MLAVHGVLCARPKPKPTLTATAPKQGMQGLRSETRGLGRNLRRTCQAVRGGCSEGLRLRFSESVPLLRPTQRHPAIGLQPSFERLVACFLGNAFCIEAKPKACLWLLGL